MSEPIDVVRTFLGLWGRTKGELHAAFRAYFTPATVWENVGMATTVGIDEAFALMDQFEEMAGVATYAVDVVNIAQNGSIVLTERIDHFLAADGRNLKSVRLMGVFEVADDKIVAWRDYFDTAASAALVAEHQH